MRRISDRAIDPLCDLAKRMMSADGVCVFAEASALGSKAALRVSQNRVQHFCRSIRLPTSL